MRGGSCSMPSTNLYPGGAGDTKSPVHALLRGCFKPATGPALACLLALCLLASPI